MNPSHNGARKEFVLRCRSGDLRLGERTLIMGVLNITPDSFSDGGLFFEPHKAIEHGLRMAEAGADLIDVGGESSRPGSDPVPLDEELNRVIPIIEELASRLQIPISVDTYKSQVAERAIEAGAQMINDISGLRFDPQVPAVAARYDTPLIIMHIKGTPKTMQQDPLYEDLMGEIVDYLREG
ncbi:MAG: dihydropteroate synthase, partial [Deltaproteobacteria bacterium]